MSFQQLHVPILANYSLAVNTYLIRLHAPALAEAIRPGQFMMIRLPKGTDPLLARPFALYDTVLDAGGRPAGIDVVYVVVGKVTGLMAGLKNGDAVEVWGPLGNGFPEPAGGEHVGLVAGGIGQTPFLAHLRELLGTRGYGGQAPRRRAQRVSLYYGVRTANLAAGVEDFHQAGATVHLASNDGSIGYHGFVTDLLEAHLANSFPSSGVGTPGSHAGAWEPEGAPQHLFGCGPEPMLHALATQAERRGIPCHLSLETPMACGIGICFSCVTAVKTEGGWDYKRVCVDGPVFDATCLYVASGGLV